MKINGTRYTKLPMHVATCPECQSQLFLAVAEDVRDIEDDSCIFLFGRRAATCCTEDSEDRVHKYNEDTWKVTAEKIARWVFRRASRG